MVEIFIFILKVFGGAVGAVLFYQLGLKILDSCFNFRFKNEPPRWARRLISEVTQLLLPLATIALLVFLSNFFNK